MSTQPLVTTIRIERTATGWSVIRRENGEETARQDFTIESEAENWAEGQRILVGNFVTQSPISIP
ncbi:hypothetical protein [Rhizobium sp.]